MNDSAVAWLRARVQARLETAKAAGEDTGQAWRRGDGSIGSHMVEADGGIVVYDEGRPSEDEADHIALNDPRDVIARCEAELGILDEHEMTWPDGKPEYETVEDIATDSSGGTHAVTRDGPLIPPYMCKVCGYDTGEPCRTVRLLASAYRHQEGYEEHWGGKP